MCGPAIPVLKFIAPMILPSLANRLFGGNKNQGGDTTPQINARPATKLTGNQSFDTEDQELKDETKKGQTEASKNAKLMRDRKKDPTATTQAGSTPQGSIGGNIAGGDTANAGVPNVGGAATY
mgnify:CR=1 FL=1|tara:strand:- start:92 stop:460 length:369 start_codon:yes stop_codon:yes gene_type:complete